MKQIIAAICLVGVAGCSEQDPVNAASAEVDPAPQVDTDPTPQTSTGGPSQTNSRDATVNGPPGAEPMENQPIPTD
jgi:hypothetical protein